MLLERGESILGKVQTSEFRLLFGLIGKGKVVRVLIWVVRRR